MAKSSGKGRRGPRGIQGKRGAPGAKPGVIRAIIDSVEKLQDENALTVKRTGQIQMQLDQTLKALKDMGDRAGRQRKKR